MSSQERTEESGPVSAAALTIPIPDTSDSLSRMFAEHHRRVLMAAYRITGNMADAEDVVQTVFLRLGTREGMPAGNEGSYLYRAAINGSLDLLRRRKAAFIEPLEAAAAVATKEWGGSPEAAVSGKELARLLRQAVGELSPRAAEMFTLRYLEDLGNREIAALMRTSQAVVAVTLYQSRSKLRKRLRELERGKP